MANVELCAKRQRHILDLAAYMLKPGGQMVYSTCTFAPSENEDTISDFLSTHSDFHIEAVPKKDLRPGLHLGTIMKNRFEPSHSLALALKPNDVRYVYNLSSEEKTVYNYINGETFECNGDKGWYLITVDDYSIGWGKLAGDIMKNHYQKGLRKKI